MTTTLKSTSRLAALVMALAAGTASGPALANAGVYVLNFNGPDVTAFAPISLNRSVNNDNGLIRATADASAALDTGTLRAATSYQVYNSTYYWQTCNACPQVTPLLQDVLTILGPGPTAALTLQMHLDGKYTITGSTGLAEIRTDVYMDVGGGSYGQAAMALDRIYSSGFVNPPPKDTLTSELIGNFAPSSYVHTTANTADGLLVMTITVPTNQPLGLNMGLDIVYAQLAPTVFAAADFQHTAQVSMSLPAGYSYTSASGVFLSASPVPEPAAAPLFAVGLALLALARHRRSRRLAAPATQRR